ncbi:MAG: hypothetical protein AAGA42_20695, partial [Actinomycetota bacterium]
VAEEVRDEFVDGVWLCELADVAQSSSVAHAVLDALGTRPRPGLSSAASVTEHCRTRSMLIVLDNCEHVLPGVIAVVEDLAAAAPSVRVLTTSRQPLGTRHETTVPLEPLALDDAAPELFVACARRAAPGRQFGADDEAAIATICRRVDGIPLAIELAAARSRSLSPAEILDHLDHALTSARGEAARPLRHRTMEAAIDTTYESLSDVERSVFEAMSVFVGGASLEAAKAVSADVDAMTLLDVLDELVAKSLLVAEPGPGGSSRYRLLEPVRQFAARRLEEHGGAATVTERHATFFCSWAEQWADDVFGAGQHLRERLDADFANVRAAVYASIDLDDADLAVRLVEAMGGAAQFVFERLEVTVWALAVLEMANTAAHPLAPPMAASAAQGFWWRGDVARYGELLDVAEALPSYDGTACEPSLSRAIYLRQVHGDVDGCVAMLDQIQPHGPRERAMWVFARTQMSAGDDTTRHAIDALLAEAKTTTSVVASIIAHGSDSYSKLMRGEAPQALRAARLAVEMARSVGAQFLSHIYVLGIGLAADAADAVELRDLEIVLETLTEQRDSGNATDMWLTMTAAVFLLRDVELAVAVHVGLESGPWSASQMVSIIPMGFPEVGALRAPSPDDASTATLNRRVVAALHRRLSEMDAEAAN